MKKLLFLLPVLFILSCGSSEDRYVDLNVNMARTTTGIKISNNDMFDYKNVEIDINSSYEYKVKLLKSFRTIEINYSKFADYKGNRFNIYQKKVKSVSVYCDLENEKTGFVYGEFK